MHHAKNRGNKEIPLVILSRLLAQSCVTLCLNYVRRVTHDCASILDIIAKGICCFHNFSHGASLHPYSFIFALVSHGLRINAATRMHTCVALPLYHVLV